MAHRGTTSYKWWVYLTLAIVTVGVATRYVQQALDLYAPTPSGLLLSATVGAIALLIAAVGFAWLRELAVPVLRNRYRF